MKFLKTEFSRFFVLGFAGGAALVLGTIGLETVHNLANGIVPPAHAAATK